MEVLPCSDVQYAGEPDAQQSSWTDFVCIGESNGFQHKNQVQMADGRMDELLLNGGGSLSERQGEGQGTSEQLPTSEGHHSGALYCDSQVDGQRLSSGSHDFADDDSNAQYYCIEPAQACSSSPIVQEQKSGGRKHPATRPLGMTVKVKQQPKKAKINEANVEKLSEVKKTDIDADKSPEPVKTSNIGDTNKADDVSKIGLVSYIDKNEDDD